MPENEQPDYMVNPWPDLLIDVREITVMGFSPSLPLPWGSSTSHVSINGHLHHGVTQVQFDSLKTACMEWHTWRAAQNRDLATAKPETPEAA